MSIKEHCDILKQGVAAWNQWRQANPNLKPNLSGFDFSSLYLDYENFKGIDNSKLVPGMHILEFLSRSDIYSTDLSNINFTDTNLTDANFSHVNLSDANIWMAQLSGANLSSSFNRGTNFRYTDLTNADLSFANLNHSDMENTNLSNANLKSASLVGTNLSSADCTKANFDNAEFWETILGDTNLKDAVGLDTCLHRFPSTLDHRTIVRSGRLPSIFLRGCGLPDDLIRYYNLAVFQAFYSCFISYSSKDEEFARKLYRDLTKQGIRCWFAPEDLKIGAKIRPAIHDAIRAYSRLLLIMSKNSVESDWVEDEVERALEKERHEKAVVLFPICLDDTVMKVEKGWAVTIRNTRNIGNFSQWKIKSAYQKVFSRLLNDLKIEDVT